MQTGHHLSNKSHLHKKGAKLSNASSVSTCGFHVCVMPSFGGVIYYTVHCTFRRPSSHTTYSVGSTGLALWVYAVCGVWGGWVGSSMFSFGGSRRLRKNFRVTVLTVFICCLDFLK